MTRAGLDPTTLVVHSVGEREAQLAFRLAHSHKIRFQVQEAKRRQRARAFSAPLQQQRVKAHQARHTASQLVAAVKANDAELTVALARKGAPLNAETEGSRMGGLGGWGGEWVKEWKRKHSIACFFARPLKASAH